CPCPAGRGRRASRSAAVVGPSPRVVWVFIMIAHIGESRLGLPRERRRRCSPPTSALHAAHPARLPGRATKTRRAANTLRWRFFFVTTPRRAGTLLPECGSPIG